MRYRITIDFDADRELTEQEIEGLLFDLQPQIEEPRIQGDEGAEDAEWRSSNIDIQITKQPA